MSRLSVHLPGLLAAAMLVAHPPICFCSDAAHGHSRGNGGSSCSCHASCPADGATGHSHGEHRDHFLTGSPSTIARCEDRPNSHGPHHESPAPCQPNDGPCPAPCHCSPSNMPTAVLSSAVTPGKAGSGLSTPLDDVAMPTDVSSGNDAGAGRPVCSGFSVTHALMISTGNPCALLSCWRC